MQSGQNKNIKSGLKPYATLDMWRGVASLCVVMHHASSTITGRFAALGTAPLYRVGELGFLGVQIFFVISGYCIAGAACSALRRSDGWWAFMRARLRRVYPPLWFSLALIVAFGLLARGLVASGRIHGSTLADKDVLHLSAAFYLSNLTLTQMVFHQTLLSIVCWTLCYEVAFYVIVSLFLVGRRPRGETVLLTGLHLVTVSALVLLVAAPQFRFFPLDLWPQFGLGALVYDVLRHPHQARPRWWLLAAGVTAAAFILSRSFGVGPLAEPSRLTFAVAFVFALLLLFLYRHDDALGSVPMIRWLTGIGLFSYSLYLTHFLTLGLVNQASRMMHLTASAHLLILAACFAAALLVARIFYQFFERPFVQTTHRLPSPPPVTAADQGRLAESRPH